MKTNQNIVTNSFISEIKNIIQDAKSNAVRSVDFIRVQMYWRLGERIFIEEQQEKDRADYGTYLIRGLAEQIEPEFGSGFSARQLNWFQYILASKYELYLPSEKQLLKELKLYREE